MSKKLKTIKVKEESKNSTSKVGVVCIPLTPSFVAKTTLATTSVGQILENVSEFDENTNKVVPIPGCEKNEIYAMIEAYDVLSILVNTFISEDDVED